MVKAAEGFHICHECVSKAVQLGKETSMGDPEPEPKQGKGNQRQTDHCLSQLETSHPTNLSSTSFEQKMVGFMFNAF